MLTIRTACLEDEQAVVALARRCDLSAWIPQQGFETVPTVVMAKWL